MYRSGIRFAGAGLAAGVLLAVPAAAQERAAVSRADVARAVGILDAAAQGQIDAGAVPGLAIAVVFEDEVVFAKGYGVRETATGAPVDAGTVFQIASLSKPVGSTVVAALVGEGGIAWDSRISDLDPAFALMEPWVTSEITIRDLYSHRSGLPAFAGDLLEDIGYGREEVLRRLRHQRPAASFRSAYAYTNFGLTEAAVAAAKAYGLEWEVASEEKLYKPLGMTSTSSRYADFMARPNKALGHVRADGKWVHRVQRQPDAQSPAGGVSSSVDDLAKWMRLQMAEGMFDGRQIVARDALAETRLPTMLISLSPLDRRPQFYGLGWNVSYTADGRHRISHSGGFEMGTGTNVNISLDDRLGVVVLTNAAPTGVAEGLAAGFIDEALYGAPSRDWLSLYKGAFAEMAAAAINTEYANPPAAPAPAAANAAYVGDYANDLYGDIAVVERDGGLALVLGPAGMTFAMTHYDRDVFTYETAGENASGPSGIFFDLGSDGTVAGLRIEALDKTGEGRFRRK